MSRTLPSAIRVPGYDQPVAFPDSMSDEDVYAALKKLAPGPQQSPRQKMAGAMDKLLPGVPESSEQAIGMGMGMSMPNPLPVAGQILKGATKAAVEGVKRAAGSMFPKAIEAGGAALDPVLQQAPRKALPAIPGILEHVPGVGGPAKVYNMIREAVGSSPGEVPANPYPRAAPPTAPAQSVLPQATAQPPPTAAPVQSVLPQATAKPAAVLNPFEAAARSNKVAELVKAIDANAGVHLGVDPRDPRFAAALADLPQQWWDGMAQVTKINKPSPETINQALEFFRDRAAQGAPQMAAGQ